MADSKIHVSSGEIPGSSPWIVFPGEILHLFRDVPNFIFPHLRWFPDMGVPPVFILLISNDGIFPNPSTIPRDKGWGPHDEQETSIWLPMIHHHQLHISHSHPWTISFPNGVPISVATSGRPGSTEAQRRHLGIKELDHRNHALAFLLSRLQVGTQRAGVLRFILRVDRF